MDWVYDGQLVDAPNGLRCIVATSMGDTARVVNRLHGVDTWFPVSELRAVEQSERCRECYALAARRELEEYEAQRALDGLASYGVRDPFAGASSYRPGAERPWK